MDDRYWFRAGLGILFDLALRAVDLCGKADPQSAAHVCACAGNSDAHFSCGLLHQGRAPFGRGAVILSETCGWQILTLGSRIGEGEWTWKEVGAAVWDFLSGESTLVDPENSMRPIEALREGKIEAVAGAA